MLGLISPILLFSFVHYPRKKPPHMTVNNRSTWMGFVLALATLSSLPQASQAAETTLAGSGLEARLAQINSALLQRARTLPTENTIPQPNHDVVAGFANRSGGGGFGNARGGGGFANTGGGGFGNARGGGGFVNASGGGGFGNVNPWRNGWGDGGGFVNRW
jgi:rSAM-associated Gly-rich repeat protein